MINTVVSQGGDEKVGLFLRMTVVIGSVKLEQWEEGGAKSKKCVNLIDVPLCLCFPFMITTCSLCAHVA